MMINKEAMEQVTELMLRDQNMVRAQAFLALEIGHQRAREAEKEKMKN